MFARVRPLALLCLCLLLAPRAAQADFVLTGFEDAAAANRWAGPDGLMGTADDPFIPGTPGANAEGGLTHFDVFDSNGILFGVWPGPAAITFLTDAQPGEPGVYEEFEQLQQFTFGQAPIRSTQWTQNVIPVLPHEIVVDPGGRTYGFDYTLKTCRGPNPGCSPILEVDHSGQGWILRPGEDAADLPGIDSDPDFGDLTDYMNSLALLAPPDWGAIYLSVSMVNMNAGNSRGEFVELFPADLLGNGGGLVRYVFAGYTEDEAFPAPEPGQALMLMTGAAVLGLARRIRRPANRTASARSPR
jgi:hypothetical protein